MPLCTGRLSREMRLGTAVLSRLGTPWRTRYLNRAFTPDPYKPVTTLAGVTVRGGLKHTATIGGRGRATHD